MSKVFYRYNPESLSYERVFPSRTQWIWTVGRHLIIGSLIGVAVFLVANYLLDSPLEKQLKKENKLLLTQYQILSKRVDENLLILTDLQERDDQLYRATFNAEPIPEAIRRPGFGGTNRYESLLDIPNSDLIISTTSKVDMMTKSLYVQSNSYDELIELLKTKEERMQNIPAIMPISARNLKRVTSGFGMRVHPILGVLRPHTGIDLSAERGAPIYATGNGVVESAKYNGGYGNCIVIDHGFGFKSLYSHCKDMNVKPGRKVKRGEQIGTVGTSGMADGPHVHYEVRVKDKPDNPAKYFFLDLTPEEYDEMLFISENR
ncbi:M23 family metallopeptidase [Bacteroidales bacterium OttesenSCG-928-A17]|nr:M23 family metallopeptidase [Bacteroidales bacterium OttesenSCG-928-A17]